MPDENPLENAMRGLVKSCDSMMTDLQPALVAEEKRKAVELIVDHALTSYQIITTMKSEIGMKDVPVMDDFVAENFKHEMMKILLDR